MHVRAHRSFDIAERPAAPCAQCGHTIAAPEWSEELSGTRKRHLWCCYRCGYSFETLVIFADETIEGQAA